MPRKVSSFQFPKNRHANLLLVGYAPLIRAYVAFILSKLRFHRHHPEFNGLFEYEEYVSLKNIDDPNEGYVKASFWHYGSNGIHPFLRSYETIGDLMTLQDQIESFQKLIFSHFRGSNNNECRISALVPLVKESYGIYRFITSMMRAMYRSESSPQEKGRSASTDVERRTRIPGNLGFTVCTVQCPAFQSQAVLL
jgi:hypothetical protein